MREIELPLIGVLAAMEREGLKLDAERLAEVGAGFGERIDQLEKDIYELADEEFTIGSPQQVGRILFEKLELSRKRRGKTGFSTDARVLQQIRDEHPIVEKIESWRELTKLKNTYLDSLPDLIDPADRPRPHHLQPGGDDHRPPLQHQPEPAEHPDPHRHRPAGARLLRRRGGRPPALRRLQPGGAPRPRPRRRRAGAEGRLPRRRGRPRGDRRRGLRDPARRGRRRPALESENGELRDRLRADRLRPRRPPQHPAQRGARNSSPATWSASRRCAASAKRWSSAPRRRAT